jgi:uncharacterized membrane protein YbhN (UPF0104 family)
MNRWLRWGLQLISLILFGLILWWAGPDAWWQVLTGTPKHLVLALLMLGLAGMISAVRLRLVTVSIAGSPLPAWPRFFHLTMTARALGLVIPRSISILGGKSVGLRAFGVPLRRAAWTVIVDNAFDLCLLGVLVTPALIFLQWGGPALPLVVLVFSLILILTGIIWWLTAQRRWRSLAAWLSRLPWLGAVLHLDPDDAPTPLPQAVAVKALGLSIMLNVALVLCYYHIARAIGLSHSWPLFAAGFPITQLSLVVALTPGGLGLFDASWYGVLLLGGVPQQEALNFVVAQRAYLFVFVLLWAGFSVLLTFVTERPSRA